MPIPPPALAVRFPIGGSAILKDPVPAGLAGGGAMLNEEYGDCVRDCKGGGAIEGKLDKELVAVFVLLPQVFEDDIVVLPLALLQSMLELCVGFV